MLIDESQLDPNPASFIQVLREEMREKDRGKYIHRLIEDRESKI